MRIAVIADTHDRLPQSVRDKIASADEIWHLGDVCDPWLLEEIRSLGPTLRVVRGNCDSHSAWPESASFELEGSRFHLVHIPPRIAPPGCDFLLHGHTHVPRDEMVGGVRFLNPGCITRPNRGAPASFAWLLLEPGQPVSWKLVLV